MAGDSDVRKDTPNGPSSAADAGGTPGLAGDAHDYALTEYTRQPIVSVLGHVDHGKTSVLDWIRGSSVVSREAGAITQHIGATEVPLDKVRELTGPLMAGKQFKVPGLLFIDTPGHSAFTSLRARGGALADIAIVVVDINEGFKPQTHEAITILKQSKTPFVVFANKIDRIDGYQSKAGSFAPNFKKQDADVQAKLEEKLYKVIGTMYELGFQTERYDRVTDFRKNIAIIPGCAVTGEGIPDALMLIVGLAQRFLEQTLQTTEEGHAMGTILEVKEEKGLGMTLDTIIYSGRLGIEDTVLVGTRNMPVETRIKALLRPKPLDEIRDPRDTFDRVKEVHAASGIKMLLGETEGIQAGAALRVVTPETYNDMFEEILAASRATVELSEAGVHLKADTIGSLEALALECKNAGIPVRTATVGPVSRRDVTGCAAENNRLHRLIMAFNVKTLPDAETAIADSEATLLTSDVIYTLMEDYEKWYKVASSDVDSDERSQIVHPGKFLFMTDHTFRLSNPAIFGARILGGRIALGQRIIRMDGKQIGTVQSMRHDDKNIPEGKQGMEVAMALDGPLIGRQIKEGDILYVDVPAGDARKFRDMNKLTHDENEVLEELYRIRRKEDKFWGM